MKVLLPLLLLSLLSGCATPAPRYVKDDHSYYSYTDNSVRSVTTNKTETHYHNSKKKSIVDEDEEFLQFKQEFKEEFGETSPKLGGKKGSLDLDDLGF